jgi:endonuclease G, mitochondrial
VGRVFRHPHYNRAARRRNDITLVVLASPVDLAPAILATDTELAAVVETTLAGFGYNDPMAPIGFGRLRKVTVNLGPIQTGSADHSSLGAALGYDPATEFVAGRKALGRDSCNGDSGGPAYIELADGSRRLAGLTSRATSDATAPCGDGGIYVRPYQYRRWIVETAAAAGIALELAP